jgi:hypothetical protein
MSLRPVARGRFRHKMFANEFSYGERASREKILTGAFEFRLCWLDGNYDLCEWILLI